MDGSASLTYAANRHCSVARALDVMGDAWSFLVLREPFFRVRRFDDIQAKLGIARNVLSARLAHLVDHGMLARQSYMARPRRYDYRLTEKGLALYPALLAMIRWADRWEADPDSPAAGAPLILTHRPCGQAFEAIVVCSCCGEPVDAHEVSYRDGPGAGHSRAGAPRRIRRASRPEAYERVRACSVARTLKIVGDQWSYLLIREFFFGVHRFDRLQAHLGIARNILTDRLTRLVDAGVLDRRLYQKRPARYEYRLTEKGLDLYGAMLALMAFGDAWLSGPEGPPLILTHKGCGRDFAPTVVCSACHAPVHAHDVTYADGPGARLAA